MSLTLTDPSFTINKDGEIEASAYVPVSTGGRTFSVRARGDGGLTSEMEIHLVRSAVQYRGQVRLFSVVLLFGTKQNGHFLILFFLPAFNDTAQW